MDLHTLVILFCVLYGFSAESKVRYKRAITLTAADIEAAMTEHDIIRSAVNVTNMEKLVWRDDLSDIASQWVDECDYSKGIPTSSAITDVGQLLHQSSEVGSTIADAVASWDDYASFYSFTVGCFVDGKCDDYLQVIWPTARSVGCGINFCASLATGDIPITNVYFVSCYYDTP
ncbi:hypothetical protein CAPTEDRAFT_205032, partial [Capitella teleta]